MTPLLDRISYAPSHTQQPYRTFETAWAQLQYSAAKRIKSRRLQQNLVVAIAIIERLPPTPYQRQRQRYKCRCRFGRSRRLGKSAQFVSKLLLGQARPSPGFRKRTARGWGRVRVRGCVIVVEVRVSAVVHEERGVRLHLRQSTW